MHLCSLAGLRRELFSSAYTWYDSTHPTVEAIPVLSEGGARLWYNQTARGVGGDWIKLKDEFCLFFYPISKVIAHRNQLMIFEQGDESLGIAWARFMHLIESGPPHQNPGGNTDATFYLRSQAVECTFPKCVLRGVGHVQNNGRSQDSLGEGPEQHRIHRHI